jgi:competence protein ComEA
MKRLKKLVSDYFGFSPKETRGFLILSILIILILSLASLIGKINFDNDKQVETDRQKLDSLIALIEIKDKKQEQFIEPITQKVTLFRFDPNKVSLEELVKLGLSKKTASTVIKYRGKGGSYRVKGDLKKIYGISDELFHKLYPYIDLPESEARIVTTTYFKEKNENATFGKKLEYKEFDINKADTVELKKLRGIGTKLSIRIINFRDKLGGFVTEDQLRDIYGLDSSLILLLQEKVFIDPGFSPKKLNVNSATVEELKAHPYIKYKFAQIIVSYRSQHGQFTDLNELKNIRIISEKELLKIIPYLEL